MIFKRFGKILVGCLLIVIILVILGAIFAGTIVKKLISGTIAQKTGIVQTNTTNQGTTYTDPKTGTTLNLGTNKVPDNFPKDFPIYPGSTVTTSLTGNPSASSQEISGQQKGFWVTFTSNDSEDLVNTYYGKNLTAYGWTNQKTQGSGTGTNWIISKGDLGGYLTVEAINGQTSILVVLGQEK